MSDDARTVADAYLEMLAERGVEYLFGNAGTDFAPIIEGLAKSAVDGRPAPTPVAVPHENLGVAMAHGYAMVTGRPQVVMVHVNVGTANAICGILNAYRDNMPILVTAGRTPLTEGGRAGSRNRNIHWAQEMFDQSGMLREAVKWDYELRDADQVATVVDRALNVATSQPRGPVYLALPREVLAEPAPAGNGGIRRRPARPAAPDPSAVDEAVEILAAAERPLIITSAVGRDPAAVGALASFAAQFAIPVVTFSSRYVCLPSEHPMHLGYQPGPMLADADAVLVLDADVPWIPDLEGPPPDCPVIHLAADPLFTTYPVRGFPCDLAITADPGLALPRLAEAMAERIGDAGDRIEERRARVADRRRALDEAREAGLAGAGEGTPIHPGWLSRRVDRIRDEGAIVVNEMGVNPDLLTLREPGTYFANSPAGGLGWGLGAALGAKLAAPERLVVAAVGDGAYQFGNPTPAHYVSRTYDLPFLTVVTNNGGWNAVRRATRTMYPEGIAVRANRMPLTDLEPTPAFEKVIEASDGYGERVEDPADLDAALGRALHAVTVEKRQALLNVICRIAP